MPAAYAALTLPRLLPAAQRRFVQCERGSALAKVALALLDEGLIGSDETGKSVDRLVVHGLQQWLTPLLGGLKWFDVGCSIHENVFDVLGMSRSEVSSYGESDVVDEAVQVECGVHPNEDHLALAFHSKGRHDLTVGAGVRALNGLAPGLGWACLDAVESVGIHYDMLTFSWAEMAASQCYWYGGDSEADWSSECDEDVSEFSGLTRAQFDAAVPDEVRARRRRPSMAQIAAWCESRNPIVRSAAERLRGLRRSGKVEQLWSMPKLVELFEWYETLDHTVWMMWDDIETMRRIGDDYFESGMYGDAPIRPVLGVTAIPLGQQGWFTATTRRWKRAAGQLRVADDLLGMLVKGCKR